MEHVQSNTRCCKVQVWWCSGQYWPQGWYYKYTLVCLHYDLFTHSPIEKLLCGFQLFAYIDKRQIICTCIFEQFSE